MRFLGKGLRTKVPIRDIIVAVVGLKTASIGTVKTQVEWLPSD